MNSYHRYPVTSRIALLCLLSVGFLMVVYYLCPEAFMGLLGMVLLVPGSLIFFIYATRIFRPR